MSAPPTGSPYAASPAAPEVALPWHRLLVRAVLVVVPGQVAGALLATVLVVPVDLRAHPHATALFWVLPGVVAGIGLGSILRPVERVPWKSAGLAAAVGAASLLTLTLLGQSRVSGAPGVTPALLGAVLASVLIQTAVAVGLWRLRLRTRSAR